MKLNFFKSLFRQTFHGQDILNLLIEINYLAIIFLIPLYFSYPFTTYNVFELSKLVLFKSLIWSLLFFTGLKFIFYWRPDFLNKEKRTIYQSFFKRYLAWPFIFIIGLGLSLFFSLDLAQSFFGSYDRQEGFLSYLFYFIWFLLLFINLIATSKDKKKKIKRLVITVVVGGFLTALYGILQILNLDFVFWTEPSEITHRVTSTLGQPNFLASYLLLIIPLSFYLLIKARKLLSKFFYFLVIIAQIITLFLTASRGALCALIIVIFLYLINLSPKINLSISKKLLIAGVFLIIIISGAFGLEYFLPGRVSSVVNLRYGSTAVRMTFYKTAVSAIAQKPLFGYGLETGKDIFIKYYKPDWGIFGDVGANTDRAHNLILDILLSAGLFGLFIFILLYYQFFYLVKNNIKNEKVIFQKEHPNFKEKDFYSLSLFLGLGAVAYLISLFFSFTIVSGEVYFFAYLAILSSLNFFAEFPTHFLNNFSYKLKKRNIVYVLGAVWALGLIVFSGLNYERRILTADYYFDNLYNTLATKDYFKTLAFNNYLLSEKTNSVNQDFYNQFLAEKLSEYYPSINEWMPKSLVRGELIRLNLTLQDQGYKNILAHAEVSGALGDLKNSRIYFSELEKITPAWPNTYAAEGKTYFANGRYQDALVAYQSALLTLPANHDSRLLNNNELHYKNVLIYYYTFNREIGNSYFALNNYQVAEKYYQIAYLNNPVDFTLFKKIADTYYLRGNLDEAIKYNERGFSRSPKDYNWPLALASLYYEKKELVRALKFLNDALNLSPDNQELINLKLEYSH